jgi:glycosyltransferase involved in cell wall biosynthesis
VTSAVSWFVVSVCGALLLLLLLAAGAWLVRRERAAGAATRDVFQRGERVFVNDRGEAEPFAEFAVERASKYLSVVVPAYNEEQRIGVMLDEALAYLLAREQADAAFSFEIIVVSDGSKDGTARVVRTYTQKHGADKIRCLDLHQNVGKGGAVRRGMLCARGQLLLMADADGASRFADVAALEQAYKAMPRGDAAAAAHCGFAVGSRAHMREVEDSGVKRSLLRNVLMWGLHVLVMIVGNIWTVQDTQCFPDDDHQILTNHGFMFLDDVLDWLRLSRRTARSVDAAAVDWRGLQVATFDRARNVVVFDTPQRLVVNKASQRDALVQLQQADGSTLVATPQHAMFVREPTATAFRKAAALDTASAPAAADDAFLARCGAWLVCKRAVVQWTSSCSNDARFWSSLTREQAGTVVQAMLAARRPAAAGALWLATVEKRDIAVQVLTQAGYAASFRPAERGSGWLVTMSRDVQPAASAQLVKRGADTSRTWCFTMPARGGDDSGFVVVRRALRDASGAVAEASAATIQGNCGFKLFGRRTAHQLFTSLHIERWAFDLELLFLAINFYRTPVVEVPIHWQEVDGSKLNVVDATLQILRDLARIRFNYTFGVWRCAAS